MDNKKRNRPLHATTALVATTTALLSQPAAAFLSVPFASFPQTVPTTTRRTPFTALQAVTDPDTLLGMRIMDDHKFQQREEFRDWNGSSSSSAATTTTTSTVDEGAVFPALFEIYGFSDGEAAHQSAASEKAWSILEHEAHNFQSMPKSESSSTTTTTMEDRKSSWKHSMTHAASTTSGTAKRKTSISSRSSTMPGYKERAFTTNAALRKEAETIVNARSQRRLTKQQAREEELSSKTYHSRMMYEKSASVPDSLSDFAKEFHKVSSVDEYNSSCCCER